MGRGPASSCLFFIFRNRGQEVYWEAAVEPSSKMFSLAFTVVTAETYCRVLVTELRAFLMQDKHFSRVLHLI